jgi:CspA family cold shock protein
LLYFKENIPYSCRNFSKIAGREKKFLYTNEINTMATGTVKWFNANKGFGFIAPDNGASDVFVHISAVERAGLSGLDDNQKVSYDIESNKGKESAINITLAS